MAIVHDAVEKGTIYGLCASGSTCVRYIGKTTRCPKTRLQDHLQRAKKDVKTHKSKWLKSLSAPPDIVIIEDAIDLEMLNEREVFWIAHYRRLGNQLVNGTDGGTGGAVFKGRKHTPETIAKMKVAAKIRGISQATRDASIAAKKGKPISVERKAVLSAQSKGNTYALGYRHTEEAQLKISESSKQRNSVANLQTPESIAKRAHSLRGRKATDAQREARRVQAQTPESKRHFSEAGKKGAASRWGKNG